MNEILGNYITKKNNFCYQDTLRMQSEHGNTKSASKENKIETVND